MNNLKRIFPLLFLSFLLISKEAPADNLQLPLLQISEERASTISVKDFGAVGDGITDDYAAIQAAAVYLCAHPSTKLVYPPGVYHISKYKVSNGPNVNTVTDIIYDSCDGVTISGYGAKIDINGSFNRGADRFISDNYKSWTNGITPFYFINSKNFVVEGFEMTGNVQNTTRDILEDGHKVTESSLAGIITQESTDFTLRDLNIHHFHNDGITLGKTEGSTGHIAARNVVLDHVNVHNNARNNLTVSQVNGAIIKNSTFKDGGRTESAYGSHAPSAGVDVEPARQVPNVDILTGNLIFDNDIFENNMGWQFVAGKSGYLESVSVTNSKIVALQEDNFELTFQLRVPNGIAKGNTFNLGTGHYIDFSRKAPSDPDTFSKIKNLVFEKNTFNLQQNSALRSEPDPGVVINLSFTNNIVNIVSPAPDRSILRLKGLLEVSNNTFTIDRSGYAGNNKLQNVVLYEEVNKIFGNTYITNLTGSQSYRITYPSTGIVLLSDESFPNQENFFSVNYEPTGNIPTVNAGEDVFEKLPTASVTLHGVASDLDGIIASYLWEKISGGAARITSSNSATTTITGLIEGTYVFRLTVTDERGISASDEVQVTINAANALPKPNAGTDITINLPINTVTLSGSASDADGIIKSYLWTKTTGGAVSIGSPNSATTTISNLVEGTYGFQLTVIDDKNASATDDVAVIVKPAADAVNISPTANAGMDVSITLPVNVVTLLGSGTDKDGTIKNFSWSKISGGAATISAPTKASTTITGLVEGIYLFRITVTDDKNATATDDVLITVNPNGNISPTANAGADASITTAVDEVTLSGSGTDTDGTVKSFSWSKVSGGAATISAPTSPSTTISSLTQGTYVFRLTVTDDKGSTGTDDVRVIVNQVSNSGPTANAGDDLTIKLPINQVTLSGSGNDPDGEITGYAWTKISGGNATITASNNASTTVTGLVQGTYVFRLTVTDNQGGTAINDVQVTVKPVDYYWWRRYFHRIIPPNFWK